MPSQSAQPVALSVPPGWRSLAAHFVPLILSAVMLALAFPMPGWWWLSYLALVPMVILALKSQRPRRLVWTSWLVGVLWWLWMVRWIIPITWPGYVCMALILGAYWPAALGTMRILDRAWRLPMTLALPLAWVSWELVRGHIIAGGFGWFTLAQSQAPWRVGQSPWLIASAALFGELTVSFTVAMTNGLIVDALTRPWFRPVTAGQTRWGLSLPVVLAVWVVTVAALYGLAPSRPPGTPGTPGHSANSGLESGRVPLAIVQTNVPQDNKDNPTAASDRRDWDKALGLVEQAGRQRPRPVLVILPETVAPAPLDADSIQYYEPNNPQRLSSAQVNRELASLALKLHTAILVGAHAADWEPYTGADGQRYIRPVHEYNSVFLYHADGRQDSKRYDKVHLVPFGEYIPYIESVPWLMQAFLKYLSPYPFDYTLTPGSQYTVFSVRWPAGGMAATSGTGKGGAVPPYSGRTHPAPEVGGAHPARLRLATPICFEDTLPEVCRDMVYGGGGRRRAELLVNVTNDGWYPGTYEPWQHLQLATLRCAELHVPMVRSVNTGVSASVDSTGRIQAELPTNEWGVLPVEVGGPGPVTPFGRWGMAPVWGLAGLTGVLTVAGVIRLRRASARKAV